MAEQFCEHQRCEHFRGFRDMLPHLDILQKCAVLMHAPDKTHSNICGGRFQAQRTYNITLYSSAYSSLTSVGMKIPLQVIQVNPN